MDVSLCFMNSFNECCVLNEIDLEGRRRRENRIKSLTPDFYYGRFLSNTYASRFNKEHRKSIGFCMILVPSLLSNKIKSIYTPNRFDDGVMGWCGFIETKGSGSIKRAQKDVSIGEVDVTRVACSPPS